MSAVLKVHEAFSPSGALEQVHLRVDGDAIDLVRGGETSRLPDRAIEAVMIRYGGPLDPGARLADVDALDLPGGRRLRHVRHLARFDVIAKDWLVLERPEDEPLCALATTVAAALDHIARAAQRA
jgi:hypothetical protein